MRNASSAISFSFLKKLKPEKGEGTRFSGRARLGEEYVGRRETG